MADTRDVPELLRPTGDIGGHRIQILHSLAVSVKVCLRWRATSYTNVTKTFTVACARVEGSDGSGHTFTLPFIWYWDFSLIFLLGFLRVSNEVHVLYAT